ncbi:MAG: helix-turn-helix transcriptional regulator [Burkholderiales bacterium]
MGIHFRHAEPGDLPRCLELVRSQNRGCYRLDLIDRLPEFWLFLIRSRRHVIHVFVDDARPVGERIQGLVSAVFVSADFLQQHLAEPAPYLAQRILDRFLAGESPLLSPRAIAASHTSEGVNVIGIDFAFYQENWLRPATLRWLPVVQNSAREFLAGYRLRSYYREIFGRDLFWISRAGGYRLETDYHKGPHAAVSQLTPPQRPYLFGMNADQAKRRTGSMGSIFFQSQEPQFHFSPAEQDLLLLALRDVSDEEAAAALSISVHTIKMRWRAAFDRTSQYRPDLFPRHEPGTPRGNERRTKLLRYLRDHMEELRARNHSRS